MRQYWPPRVALVLGQACAGQGQCAVPALRKGDLLRRDTGAMRRSLSSVPARDSRPFRRSFRHGPSGRGMPCGIGEALNSTERNSVVWRKVRYVDVMVTGIVIN